MARWRQTRDFRRHYAVSPFPLSELTLTHLPIQDTSSLSAFQRRTLPPAGRRMRGSR